MLAAFQEALKSSIHVSELSGVRNVEVPDLLHISGALFRESMLVLERAIQGLAPPAASPRLRAAWMPQVAPERLMQPLEQAFWQPMMPLQAAAT